MMECPQWKEALNAFTTSFKPKEKGRAKVRSKSNAEQRMRIFGQNLKTLTHKDMSWDAAQLGATNATQCDQAKSLIGKFNPSKLVKKDT